MIDTDFREKKCMGVCPLRTNKLVRDRHCLYNHVRYQYEVLYYIYYYVGWLDRTYSGCFFFWVTWFGCFDCSLRTYVDAEQSRNQTVTTRKATGLHVILEIPLICYSSELSKLYYLRYPTSTIYNGYQFLLHSCPSPILPLDWDLAFQKL